MSFSGLALELGCPLRVVRQSWSAIAPNGERAIFTIWADQLIDGRCILWPTGHYSYMKRFGAKELHRILLRTLSEPNIETLGIRCEARDRDADTRSRKNYDKQDILLLSITRQAEGIVANVVGQMPTLIAINRSPERPLQPVPYAIDDLHLPLVGNPTPDRIEGRTFGYLRNPEIRSAVLARANGRCEYCGELGFRKSSGDNYVEAHHIIALAEDGPDTLNNVIALCSNHHREAHYGEDAELLEDKFVDILRNL